MFWRPHDRPQAASEPRLGPARRHISLAVRLTVWCAAWAFVLLLAASAFLYHVLKTNLYREDDQYLAGKLLVFESLLKNPDRRDPRVRREIVYGRDVRPYSPILARVMRGTRLVGQSAGMGQTLPPSDFPAPRSAGRHPEPADIVGQHEEPFRAISVRFKPPGRGGTYIVQLALDHAPEVRILSEYREALWAVLAAGLITSAAGAYAICRRGLKPLRDMDGAIRRIQSSTLHERLNTRHLPAEVAGLAVAFNGMMGRLEDAFERLARFSADIAHELRTPVHALRAQAEVALGQGRSVAEYRVILETNLEECQRITRLIDNLLFLARAQSPQAHLDRRDVNCSDELAKLREFYEPAANEAGIALRQESAATEAPPGAQGAKARLDRTLFHRAVANLIENAIAHTPVGGTITLRALAKDGGTVITVCDTGSGIAPEDLPYVFDRFRRGDASRSKNTGGAGLGLALVKSIVELHGGAVAVESAPGAGTCAKLWFPGA